MEQIEKLPKDPNTSPLWQFYVKHKLIVIEIYHDYFDPDRYIDDKTFWNATGYFYIN